MSETVSSSAFYEERIRLLEEKIRFLQQQNGSLRIALRDRDEADT